MTDIQAVKPSRSKQFLVKIILLVAILIFALVIAAHFIKQTKTNEFLANMPPNITPITAIKIEPQDWIPVINSTALIRPNQGAMLSAQSTGMIQSVNIKSGQHVKKGQVLVELDNSVEKANLIASEAKLPAAKLTYQRYLSLAKTNSVSKTELDNAKATYENLVATINALKATIERRQIIAPFDGEAGIVKVNVGEYVTAGTEIVRVEDRSKMKVNFGISQDQLSQLHLQQQVKAVSDVYPDETFNAVVTAIEPAINKSTGLVEIEATFEGNTKLISGMFVHLRVERQTESAQIVVPQVAISYNMYGETAFILVPLTDEDKAKLGEQPLDGVYKAQQITVKTKDRRSVYAQLEQNEALKAGTYIITGGLQNVSGGSYVKLVDKPVIGATEPETKTNL
ncbi:efflux RND transporter periplasmic adaptor subunit [Gallibacterium salpingitidis]|uniref:efflux RND transporter periplasmic adaptor subunit n=1 Tax=Gallibacterium salpingitidis TaxID=505341 RepID=UPI00266FE036|nr:efflux RND transporter periplasmic adaptor subunit [Gallibacterium salpingitidis]WKT00349.1 efflux RND transporter periplasmic adaptor subunit [Gallibacterium salpingitidis]